MIQAAETPLVFGVLNVTPDSFSDGGRYLDPDRAIAHGLSLVRQGADVIDVGGESTRPGAEPVPADEELRRVLPVVAGLVAAGVRVSIDTRSARTAAAAVEAGASVVNDVDGGADPRMLQVVAGAPVDYVVMHSRGPAGDPGRYTDVVREVTEELARRVDAARRAGIEEGRLIVDPGLGFAKGAADNWTLLAHLADLAPAGRRIMVGASRKRFLGALVPPDAAPEARDLPTAVLSALLAERGVWAVRVHDVAATRTALATVGAWRGAA
jgi:dihydropteroate synthase